MHFVAHTFFKILSFYIPSISVYRLTRLESRFGLGLGLELGLGLGFDVQVTTLRHSSRAAHMDNSPDPG